jgi:hypothetical protein
MGSPNRAISRRAPSRDATHVSNLVVTDRATGIRRDGNDCQSFTRERSELHLESGACPVHEHDGTDVALLEALCDARLEFWLPGYDDACIGSIVKSRLRVSTAYPTGHGNPF